MRDKSKVVPVVVVEVKSVFIVQPFRIYANMFNALTVSKSFPPCAPSKMSQNLVSPSISAWKPHRSCITPMSVGSSVKPSKKRFKRAAIFGWYIALKLDANSGPALAGPLYAGHAAEVVRELANVKLTESASVMMLPRFSFKVVR